MALQPLPSLPVAPAVPASTAAFQQWVIDAIGVMSQQHGVINANLETIASGANQATAERIAVAVEGLLVEARRPFTGGAA